VTGTLPFTARTVQQLLRKILDEVPVPAERVVPTLPEGFGDVIARALARPAINRFASARALARALSPFAPGRVERERELSASIAA
jgi:hypothetical protein